MKLSWAFTNPLSSAVLLLPLLAAADSQLQAIALRRASGAAAHVDFKIVIPTVLALDLGSGIDRGTGTRTVAIMSNGRSVTLGASVTASDVGRSSVIISATAGRTIAQDAACTLGDAYRIASMTARGRQATALRRLICTVSIP